MPQGYELGPVPFLIFINDLDSDVISSILKSAADTKIFSKVIHNPDRIKLLDNLNKLCELKCRKAERDLGVLSTEDLKVAEQCMRSYKRQTVLWELLAA